MIDEINTVLPRVEAHAKTLIEGAAPHQQELANDMLALAAHAKAASSHATEVHGQLAELRGNMNAVLHDRDLTQKARDAAQTEIDTLKAQVADLTKQLDAAKALGIASTAGKSHADLKEDIKANHKHEPAKAAKK